MACVINPTTAQQKASIAAIMQIFPFAANDSDEENDRAAANNINLAQ